MDRIEAWAREIERARDQFLDPSKKPAPRAPACPPSKGLTVRLAVRNSRLSIDTQFVHHSTSISRLEARLEAEKAARAAGWAIVGYVIDIEPM